MSFASISSICRNPGSRSISAKLLCSRKAQKLSIVVICAVWSSVSCRCRCRFSGFFSSLSLMAFAMRSRIWAAAARVNVTTSSLSISTGFCSSVISRMMRSTSTAVLPLPAAAETRMLCPRASITFCCCVVNCTAIFLPRCGKICCIKPVSCKVPLPCRAPRGAGSVS